VVGTGPSVSAQLPTPIRHSPAYLAFLPSAVCETRREGFSCTADSLVATEGVQGSLRETQRHACYHEVPTHSSLGRGPEAWQGICGEPSLARGAPQHTADTSPPALPGARLKQHSADGSRRGSPSRNADVVLKRVREPNSCWGHSSHSELYPPPNPRLTVECSQTQWDFRGGAVWAADAPGHPDSGGSFYVLPRTGERERERERERE